MTRALSWSSILYRNLSRVYAEELQNEFGAEMALVFEDDLREASVERGVPGFVAVWQCAALELLHAGLSKACATPSFIVPLISLLSSALCLGGELALARVHATAPYATITLAEAVWAVVVWPSLTASAVSFAAARAGTRIISLRLIDHQDPHSPAVEGL